MGLPVRSFDAVIVGAGGAGLRAALQLSEAGLKVAVLSKVFPTRSHTVAAQGGISAALGNMGEDDWQWHMYDTVKGSDWLGDQDAIEYHVPRGRRAVVIELEHFGMPFDRTADGTIYQRPFGGHTADYGEGPVQRACAAADRTGHAMLHTLYQQQRRVRDTQFFVEWMALDLITRRRRRRAVGVVALEMETGDVHDPPGRRAILLATGGAGRIYASSTNAFINTGDGLGMALRAGTAAARTWSSGSSTRPACTGAGVLITEGVRGEGGYPAQRATASASWSATRRRVKDLASRDVVSRAMAIEIHEGRGCGPNKDHVLLKLDHLGAEVIDQRLPRHLARSPRTSPASTRPRTRSRWCRPATTRWAASRPTINGQVVAPRTAHRRRGGAGPVARWASAPASRCTAPTGWAPTRCSTWWCSARPLATTPSSGSRPTRCTKPLPAAAADAPGPPGAPRRPAGRRVA
jgi:succinate dehydrogenase / fumarate reductase flavoprotein subunit